MKNCEFCGKPFVRPKDYSHKQWQERRYCSISCGKRNEPKSDPRKRFEANYTPEPNSGCWLWTGTIGREGYGQIKLNGKLWRAHRLAYELFIGEMPDGLGALHKCDNRQCVNPDHLYAGTTLQNNRDMFARGRAPLGEAKAQAKLTEAIVRAIRQSTEDHTTLAKRYGVSRPAVRNARIGRTWAHVE